MTVLLPTQLILIEGIPGSGKSTTAAYLATRYQQRGIACQWFHEVDEKNPIRLGFDTDSPSYRARMLGEWEALVKTQRASDSLLILESRFWNNIARPMYANIYSATEVAEFVAQLQQVMQSLKPVLIHIVHDDPIAVVRQVGVSRGSGWFEWVVRRDLQEPWYRARHLTDVEGWLTFFATWQRLAESLYEDCPFHKVELRNPHADWTVAYQILHEFLGFTPSARAGAGNDLRIQRSKNS